jgi:hypothetical protein
MSAAPALGRRERRLLLTCARRDLGTRELERLVGLVAEPLDWEAIAFHARLHSVGPLAHRHLDSLPNRDCVPAAARRPLLALAHRAAYRNRFFSRENAALIDAFSRAGSRVIVPKAISLVELVYGDLRLRPLIDLAFVVRPHEVSAVEAALLARGYAPTPVGRVRALWRWSCPHRWYARDGEIRFSVVLQAGLLSWPRRHRLTTDALWKRARNASLGGTEALVPGPVDQLICLCLQTDCMGFFNRAAADTVAPEDLLFADWSNNRLIRFTDIHETLRHHRDEIDWERLVSRARACAVEDAVRVSLELTRALLGTEVPEVLARLSPGLRPRLRRRLLTAARAADRRPVGRRLPALAWNGLGPRRQLELLRLVGLAELAFPGLGALRAEHRRRSRPALAALAVRHASGVLTRSARECLRAHRGMGTARSVG